MLVYKILASKFRFSKFRNFLILVFIILSLKSLYKILVYKILASKFRFTKFRNFTILVFIILSFKSLYKILPSKFRFTKFWLTKNVGLQNSGFKILIFKIQQFHNSGFYNFILQNSNIKKKNKIRMNTASNEIIHPLLIFIPFFLVFLNENDSKFFFKCPMSRSETRKPTRKKKKKNSKITNLEKLRSNMSIRKILVYKMLVYKILASKFSFSNFSNFIILVFIILSFKILILKKKIK